VGDGVDAFLGLTAGTTQYGPGYRAWGITGAFVGDSDSTVTAAAADLAMMARINSIFVDTTGHEHICCSFQPSELLVNSAGPTDAGGVSTLTYLLVLRQSTEAG